jgi:single-strand DNA-binding protein
MTDETTTADGRGAPRAGAARGARSRARPVAAVRRPATGPDLPAARNEVPLVGRLPAAPQERELPSGDRVVTWRLVVDRGPGRRPPEGVRATTVDTLECVAWTASLRRTALTLLPDDVVEVQGSLRRRFWRAGTGAASRCEVEAAALRRLNRRARLRR